MLQTRKDVVTANCSLLCGTVHGLEMATRTSWSDQQEGAREAAEWQTPKEEGGWEKDYPVKKTFYTIGYLDRIQFYQFHQSIDFFIDGSARPRSLPNWLSKVWRVKQLYTEYHCTVLHCKSLYSITLLINALFCTAHPSTLLHLTPLHCITVHNTVFLCIVLLFTVLQIMVKNLTNLYHNALFLAI